jgi:hypothetical protein
VEQIRSLGGRILIEMKRVTNNEIDLLLRKLSRLDGANKVADEPQRFDEKHLDADELNSYAENALPAAARAHYTEHLADCSRCRRIVIDLSRAAGLVVLTRESRGVKKYLATLFSPLVLRYAVPALSLVVIAAIGLIVFRQRTADDLLAKRMNTRPTASETQKEAAGLTSSQPQSGSLAKTESEAEKNNKAGEITSQTKSAPGRGDTSASSADDARQESKQSERDASVAGAPSQYAPEPVTPSVPKSAVAANQPQQDLEVADKKKVTAVAEQPPPPKDMAKAQPKEEFHKTDEIAASRSGPAKAPGSSVGGAIEQRSLAEERRGREVERNDKREPEIRSISGRRFRREGGVWTDTAYESSRSTVSLTRGSEQFRALVADEPGIRTIAEQLEGEIIVVWKSRAYRIR